jgi:hypothetical protein
MSEPSIQFIVEPSQFRQGLNICIRYEGQYVETYMSPESSEAIKKVGNFHCMKTSRIKNKNTNILLFCLVKELEEAKQKIKALEAK